MGSRSNNHKIDSQGENYLRYCLENDGELIYRNVTGRDYGIDGIIELFENDFPTGKLAIAQIKSTSNKIDEMPFYKGYISSKNISESNKHYINQKNIPAIFFYVYMEKDKEEIYYTVLNPIKEKDYHMTKTTLKFPIKNKITKETATDIIRNIINEYY